MAPLPVRALPGIGYKADAELGKLGIRTATDARAFTRHQLEQALGSKTGSMQGCMDGLSLDAHLFFSTEQCPFLLDVRPRVL